MKALLTLIALVSIQQASAKDLTNLKKGDLGLYNVEAKVISVKEACPADSHIRCVRGGSDVTLEVPLHGCLDRLAGSFTDFKMIDGVATLQFSGVAVATEESTTARCIKAPSVRIKTHIPYTEDFKLVNLISSDKMKGLEKSDRHLTAASAKIKSVSALCPQIPGRMTCMAVGIRVQVEVSLGGCMDRLGHYAYKIDQIDGQNVLTFAAVNVGTEASTYTRCYKMPTETVEIIHYANGLVDIDNLDFVVR